MKTKHIILTGSFFMVSFAAFGKVAPETASPSVDPKPGENKVQIAILLDTSSSMDGLIEQTKTQLWKVVNTFTESKKDGVTPYVEVALYEYGNNGLHVGNHYIRQIEPMTRDLDELSRELFALKTNGGEEYCGAVIQRALSDLAWDSSPTTYKAIFIAGNEPFTQGPVDARVACKDALKKGVVVNTIHCGDRESGIAGAWHDGAALAEGKFMLIDQDRAVAHIDAPQDKRISELGAELNKTYVGYGERRQEAAKSQELADQSADAFASSGASVARAVSKASINYNNVGWDLVDALREKKVDLKTIPADQLPAEMQSMDGATRAAHLEKAATKRKEIQDEILKLNREREEFVAKERTKQAEGDAKTLDEVMVETAREQAIKLGYVFAK